MESERTVMGCQHGMDGMTEFMSEGRHLTSCALVVHHHIWRHLRQNRPAECTAALTLANFAVNTALVKNALCQICDLWRKGVERVQYHGHSVVPTICFL